MLAKLQQAVRRHQRMPRKVYTVQEFTVEVQHKASYGLMYRLTRNVEGRLVELGFLGDMLLTYFVDGEDWTQELRFTEVSPATLQAKLIEPFAVLQEGQA